MYASSVAPSLPEVSANCPCEATLGPIDTFEFVLNPTESV